MGIRVYGEIKLGGVFIVGIAGDKVGNFIVGEFDFFFFVDLAVFVRIESGVRNHGGDAPGEWIHDEDLAAVSAIIFDCFGEEFFDFHLDGAVDGEDDVIAVHGRADFTFADRDLEAAGIALGSKDSFFAF